MALKEECCFYSDKTGLVQDSINRVKTSLEERKRQREQQEAWYKNWFSFPPWVTTLLPSLLGPLLGLLLLLSFGPWAFKRLTTVIKSRVDASLRFPQVHYHQIDNQATEEPYDDAASGSPRPSGLQFSTLAGDWLSPWGRQPHNSHNP